jgi:hypothetical protein
MPLLKGVYRLGSKVSVWAMPPAIHNKITVSALAFLLLLQEDKKLDSGAPAANAPRVAALVLFKKSLLFH